MRVVEDLVRRKLEKRAADELSPKPDPYELHAPHGERETESLLAQTLNNFIQIKAKALGHRKKLLKRLSRRAPLDSFINSYRGLKLMAELLRI